ALATEQRAMSVIRESGGNPDYQWQVDSRIGHIERALGRTDEALASYRRAIDGIRPPREGALRTAEGRAGVLCKARDVYAATAALLVDLHRDEEALATAERGRARAFLDVLAESRIGLADDLSDGQRRREAGIQARISSAQRSLLKAPGTERSG